MLMCLLSLVCRCNSTSGHSPDGLIGDNNMLPVTIQCCSEWFKLQIEYHSCLFFFSLFKVFTETQDNAHALLTRFLNFFCTCFLCIVEEDSPLTVSNEYPVYSVIMQMLSSYLPCISTRSKGTHILCTDLHMVSYHCLHQRNVKRPR